MIEATTEWKVTGDLDDLPGGELNGMPWVRFDDQFTINHKVAGLSDKAYILHGCAIFWCARNLTDGLIQDGKITQVAARVKNPRRYAGECVDQELWHLAGHACLSVKCPAPVEGGHGWVVHDYWEFQPTREHVLAARAVKAENGRRGGVASGASRRSDTEANDEANAKQTRGVRLNSRPVPSRPVKDLVDVLGPLRDRYAHMLDDGTLRQVADAFQVATGEPLTLDQAALIAGLILRRSNGQVRYVAQYCRRAILQNVGEARELLGEANRMMGDSAAGGAS